VKVIYRSIDGGRIARSFNTLKGAQAFAHLGRYANEFAFRLNEGNVKRHTLERLESFATATAGKRLTYKDLIAEE